MLENRVFGQAEGGVDFEAAGGMAEVQKVRVSSNANF